MKNRRLPLLAATAAAVVLGTLASPAHAATTPPRDPTPPPSARRSLVPEPSPELTGRDLAEAMEVPAGDILEADLMGSDVRGVTIAGNGVLPAGYVTGGPTAAVLSTGIASGITDANDSGSRSSTLDGLDNVQGNDLVRLHLKLQVPQAARCLAFDVRFLSEEFPEYVNSQFNDAFTAQVGTGELGVSGNDVVAEGNFAQDEQANALAVNTAFGVAADTGTTYDGATPRVRASRPVDPGTQIDLYLSIQDLGDSAYDSAALLDNFFWSADAECRYGSTTDTDGDGLLDEWETGGLTQRINGRLEKVDLPAMGADPAIPDVFVELDYMWTDNAHNHRPDPAAIAEVITAFQVQGVQLHVDYGHDAPDRYAKNPTWGVLSRGEQLTHQDNLGTQTDGQYDWAQFDALKAAHFDQVRQAVFHYNVWAHNLAPQNGGTSGLSRGAVAERGASDFIVSLGSFAGGRGSTGEQTGTFMHELGHNLGLGHGGGDDVNNKPNYFSVMNYYWQLDGLPDGLGYNYSGERAPDIDENDLDEPTGIGYYGAAKTTRDLACTSVPRDDRTQAIDWNCDGDATDVHVGHDVNGDGDQTVLEGHIDWGFLTFTGGSIGLPGSLRPLPARTTVNELTYEESLRYRVGGRPKLESLTGPPSAVAVGAEATVTATWTVPDADARVAGASVAWGDGTTTTMPQGGTADRASSSATHTYAAAGVYTATVTVTGGGGTATSTVEIPVYDTAAGRVDATGQLTIPAGSWSSSPGFSATAGIELHAGYASGATTPTGSLKVTANGRTFLLCPSFDWLVVKGDTATLQGSATIGGKTYTARATLVAGSPGKARVVAWDPALGGPTTPAAVVFDNARTDQQPQTLTGGTVTIG